MKLLLQRVSSAAVHVEGRCLGSIESGIMALLAFGKADDHTALAPMLEKLLHLRIFPDERGRFHFSLLDTEGGLLLIPQFTLYADTSKGRRPEFFEAKEPTQAAELFDQFCALAEERLGARLQRGQFGAEMKVSLVNDGPVTIMLER